MMIVRFFDVPFVIYLDQHKLKEEKNVIIQQWPLTYSTALCQMVVILRRVKYGS